jgi:hypothetical protein
MAAAEGRQEAAAGGGYKRKRRGAAVDGCCRQPLRPCQPATDLREAVPGHQLGSLAAVVGACGSSGSAPSTQRSAPNVADGAPRCWGRSLGCLQIVARPAQQSPAGLAAVAQRHPAGGADLAPPGSPGTRRPPAAPPATGTSPLQQAHHSWHATQRACGAGSGEASGHGGSYARSSEGMRGRASLKVRRMDTANSRHAG